MPRTTLSELRARDVASLVRLARDAGVAQPSSLSRQQLIFEILRARCGPDDRVPGAGVLEVLPDGFGFLRDPGASFLPGPDDVYVSPSQIRRFNLRTGDEVSGLVRSPKEGERYFALIKVEALNGADPEAAEGLRAFEHLTPAPPRAPLWLEHDPEALETRLIDLFCPLGRGQRAMVLAPPGARGDALLARVLRGAAQRAPEVQRVALLVDARPEDVAESRAELAAEVVATTFDEPAARQLQVAELVLARAQRAVERGQDVLLVVDSLNRLARAFLRQAGQALGAPPDPAALHGLKRLLACARATEEGGSLTLLALAEVDTGARADELLVEDLRAACNARIHLDRARRGRLALRLHDSENERLGHLLGGRDLDRRAALRAALQGQVELDLAWIEEALSRHPRNQDLLDGIS